MKKILATIGLILSLTLSFGQTPDIQSMVDSLQYLKVDTLDCEASQYWKIIALGDKAIPYLIDKLSDTTLTNISYKCKTTKLNVAEVSYFALEQIAFFPPYAITHIQFDVIYGNGCGSFDDYFYNNKNKPEFQIMLKEWYAKNKAKYKPEKISKKYLNDCQKKYKIDTYYWWTE